MEQTNDRTFLETEPVGKLLLKLALPTVAAQLINMMYNIVDRMYIGHIPGDGAMALTGVGVCMPLIMVVSAFAALISNGGAPRATIFMGKGEKDKAEKTLGNCFCTQTIVSLILTAFLLAGNRGFLLAFGASENTISFAADYMNIYAIGTIFVQLTLGMNAFITAQGFARTSMLSVLIGAVINIVLDPVFIFGFGMGVKGAALATVLSQACSCIWVLAFLCGKKTHLRLKGKNMVLQANIIWPSIALGTAMLYRYKDRSDGFLFGVGTLLGGGYEYLCSVFTEIVFGKVFWDYSKLPFNLGGRINLLYCFFWGIAAVVWFKKIYPFAARWIEKIPMKAGRLLTWVLIVFMCCNVAVSCVALVRYDERSKGIAAESSWQQWADEHYDDAKMAKIYPNAKVAK